MKTLKLLTVLTISLIITSCNGQDKNKRHALDPSITKIEVIDFHSTHRCITCNAIEANTKYTLETYFAKELDKNKITFQVINVDDEKNYKISKKFEASSTSLFLNVINNGKETKINLTDFAFFKGKDQEAFSKGLKSKIEKQLSKM